MTLSGRVDALETSVAFNTQDLLQKIDLTTFSTRSIVWNQQLDAIEDSINTMSTRLSTLQTLYTNLYKTVVDNQALFTGHTGQDITGSDPAHSGAA